MRGLTWIGCYVIYGDSVVNYVVFTYGIRKNTTIQFGKKKWLKLFHNNQFSVTFSNKNNHNR